MRQRAFDPRARGDKLRDIARKFLAQRQRRRVLQMGAADLDDIMPAAGLGGERVGEFGKRREQPNRRFDGDRDVQRGRETVVRRLAHVDMVVGVDRRLAAARARQLFVGDPRDHLIRVHVRLGAAARLPDRERELVVIVARDDRIGGVGDRVGEPRVEALASVHPRRRALDPRERVDDRQRHPLVRGEGEIMPAAFGLRAPIGVGRNLDLADAVAFDPRLAHASIILVTKIAPAQIIVTRPSNCQ